MSDAPPPTRSHQTAPRRRPHPSKGARVIALTTSVTATLGVAATMHLLDGSTIAGAATTASTTGASSTARGTYADGSYTGTAVYNGWGNVQVQVTIANGKITTVQQVQEPGDRRSVEINESAQPVLEAEAVAAQSAKINIVSGATYTSNAYASSLQAALDQAAATTPAASTAAVTS